MIDIDLVRKNPGMVADVLGRRGFYFNIEQFKKLDELRKNHQRALEDISARQNKNAEAIALAKKSGGSGSGSVTELITNGESLRTEAAELSALFRQDEDAIATFLAGVPNIPLESVPDGETDRDNVLLRQVGAPKTFDYTPRTHDEIGLAQGGMDFEVAAAMSGSRFAVVSGDIARLHRALIQFMLDTHVDENGYREVEVPYLVRENALFGTGQLPKFEEDLFKLERDGMYLIPTAEVSVTNLVANRLVPASELPMAYVARTPCFRREAGSAGRDVKGLIRQHQFEKVELVRICTSDQVDQQFDLLLGHAESILQKLELPYKVVQLCAGDMGFSAERTVDLEVWMPGQSAWREISSVSRFGTFQAKRMKARYKDDKGKNKPLHTLNGSGLAAGRTLAAVLENYQQADGSVRVPEVLQPYMRGKQVLSFA